MKKVYPKRNVDKGLHIKKFTLALLVILKTRSNLCVQS